MTNQTEPTKAKDIKRAWHLVDLKDQTLGRVSSDIAQVLMGKSKSYFVRNLDCGDYVVAINAKYVKTTGNKETKKMYYRHSGYPGGFKAEALKDLRVRKPQDVIEHAVKGMLPQNRLRASILKRLYVFPEAEHRFQDKIKEL